MQASGASAAAFALPAQAPRPNILWITCEDLSPVLGCYGDRYAHTPNLDRLATEGIRFTRAYSAATVCTPARSCLITGVHATSMGSMHLRGLVPLSSGIRCFPEYLREAGYYCSNNQKQDYNFQAPNAWDESSGKAHWRKRRPGQPFFSVFNCELTHQGRIRYSREEFEKINRELRPEERHDPAKAPVPPYFPDTPLVRMNMAILYTQATLMDKRAGDLLTQLREDGLEDDTIVFFFSDHGTGLPRGKRWLHDSGTRVPLLVRFPKAFRHLAPGSAGSVSDRPVSFVEFPATVLNVAGVKAPSYMQGKAIFGPRASPPAEYVFTTRDRVDEIYEVSRAICDGRYRYIRNYLPHRPRMQHDRYSEAGHVDRELRRLAAENKLHGRAAWLMAPTKPAEELYDMKADPDEFDNLAASPKHAALLERLRTRLRQWIVETRDTGLLPEPDMIERSAGQSPYDMARSGSRYPVERVLGAAELCGRGAGRIPDLRKALADGDAAVRYWGAVGLTALRGQAAPARAELTKALSDSSLSVRIAAAEALCGIGAERDALPVLIEAVGNSDSRVQLLAINTLVYIGEKARPAAAALQRAIDNKTGPAAQRLFVDWIAQRILDRLKATATLRPARDTAQRTKAALVAAVAPD